MPSPFRWMTSSSRIFSKTFSNFSRRAFFVCAIRDTSNEDARWLIRGQNGFPPGIKRKKRNISKLLGNFRLVIARYCRRLLSADVVATIGTGNFVVAACGVSAMGGRDGWETASSVERENGMIWSCKWPHLLPAWERQANHLRGAWSFCGLSYWRYSFTFYEYKFQPMNGT